MNKTQINQKPKIAIFDLTDCEGCEIEIINLKEKLLKVSSRVDIISWRLVSEEDRNSKIDVALVEGSPYSTEELKLLKKIRKNSKYLFALGACASTGGVPAAIVEEQRKKAFQKIYSPRYHPSGQSPKPIDHYVKVDFHIPGCPPNPKQIEKVLADIIAHKPPQKITYPVCFECKKNQNPCLLEQGKLCLGPITRGGCNSACINASSHCWGCWGLIDQPAISSLTKRLKNIGLAKAEIKKHYEIFWQELPELSCLFKGEK